MNQIEIQVSPVALESQLRRVSPLFLDNACLRGGAAPVFEELDLSFEQPSFKKRRTVELPARSLNNTDNFRVGDKTESNVDDLGSEHKCCIEKISVEEFDDATTDDESPCR